MKKALIALTIAVAPWLAELGAQQPPAPPAPVTVVQFLGLSEAQTTRFQQLLESLQAATGGLGQQISIRQQQLDSLLSSDQPDPALLARLLVEIHALQKQAAGALQNYHETFLSLLSSEQQQKARMVIQAGQLAPAIRAFAEVRLIEPPH